MTQYPKKEYKKKQPEGLAIKFTADAIAYLGSVVFPLNLDEWEWHEEVVEGKAFCIVTDRIFLATNAGASAVPDLL